MKNILGILLLTVCVGLGVTPEQHVLPYLKLNLLEEEVVTETLVATPPLEWLYNTPDVNLDEFVKITWNVYETR